MSFPAAQVAANRTMTHVDEKFKELSQEINDRMDTLEERVHADIEEVKELLKKKT